MFIELGMDNNYGMRNMHTSVYYYREGLTKLTSDSKVRMNF